MSSKHFSLSLGFNKKWLHICNQSFLKFNTYIHTYKGDILFFGPFMTAPVDLLSQTFVQWAGWKKVVAVRCAWTAQAQCTDIKFKQPLMISECLVEQVWRDGNESQTAWTAGGVSAVHWLMLSVLSPSSSFIPFMDSHIVVLLFTRLWANEYIALSVMFWQ